MKADILPLNELRINYCDQIYRCEYAKDIIITSVPSVKRSFRNAAAIFLGIKVAGNGQGRRRTRKFSRLVIPLIVFNSHFSLLEQQMNSNTRRWRCPFIRNRCGTLPPRKHSSAILRDEYSFVLSPEAGLYLLLPCLPMCLESIRMIHDSRAVAPL